MLEHSRVGKEDERDLGKQMGRMNLSHGEAQAMDTGVHFATKLLFSDDFFYKLLQKELPSVAFC